MPKAKKYKLAPIHEIIPKEILVMILRKLNLKSISLARRTCKHWNEVIYDFKIREPHLCKCVKDHIKSKKIKDNKLHNFSKTILHTYCSKG